VIRRQLTLSIAVILLAIAIPLLAPYDPQQIVADNANTAPNSAHWLGTDSFGRDVLSRLMYGAPVTLGRAALATVITCVTGGIIGVSMGAFGGWLDAFVSMWVNASLAIPSFVVALVVVTLIGQGELSVVLAVMASQVAVYARYARSIAQTISHQPYVESTRALGAGWHWVLSRHITPNALPQLVGFSGVIFAYSILTGAALGFIGIAGEVGQPEWGAMLAEGRQSLRVAPWVSLSAGAAITLVVFTVNTITTRWARG